MTIDKYPVQKASSRFAQWIIPFILVSVFTALAALLARRSKRFQRFINGLF